MEGQHVCRPLTFRLENIPAGTTAEQLQQRFHPEDRPYVQVRSIVPAVDNYDSGGELTATVLYRQKVVGQSNPEPRLLDDDISIDKDFYGLTPLYQHKGPIAADVIAITGLAGHAYGSWAHSSSNMWLRDYLPKDIQSIRVILYGYKSQLQGVTSRGILADYSTNFIHRLEVMRATARCEDRPIILIGHSLGCLIIKKVRFAAPKALSEINGSRYDKTRLPVRSIIFFGAPHRGLETAALETLVKSEPSDALIKELKVGSPTLRDLSRHFARDSTDISILTCYELYPTKTAIKMPDGQWKREGSPELMVPEDSAHLDHPKETLVACHADHTQMAKIKRGESSIYWAIRAAVLKVVEEQTEPAVVVRDLPVRAAYDVDKMNPALHIDETPENLPQSTTKECTHGNTAVIMPDANLQKELYSTIREKDASTASALDSDEIQETVPQSQSKMKERNHGSTAVITPDANLQKELCSAIRDKDASAVQRLMDKGACVHTSAQEEVELSEDPFLLAAADGQEQILKILVKHGPNPRKRTSDEGDTALHLLFRHREESRAPISDSLIALLLRMGFTLEARNKNNATPLLTCARWGHDVEAKLLLERGADMEAVNKDGAGVLHIAAYSDKQLHVMEIFISEGASMEARTNEGTTPLMISAQMGQIEAIRSLLSHGADLYKKAPDGWTAIHFAALHDRVEVVKLFLSKHPSSLNIRTNRDSTPLQFSTFPRDTTRQCTTRLLLEAGADIEAITNVSGRTALSFAATWGSHNALKELLAFGATIEARDFGNRSALHLATYYGHVQCVEILLQKGANPLAKDKFGQKPSEIGYYEGKDEVDLQPPSDESKTRCTQLLRDAEKEWKNAAHRKSASGFARAFFGGRRAK